MCRVGITVFSNLIVVVLITLSSNVRADDLFVLEGFSKPNRVAKVAAMTSGIIDELAVEEGQFVRKGECLARLDSTVHQKSLAVALAGKKALGEIAAAKSELDSSKTRIEIIRDLASRAHASQEEQMRAEMEFQLASAHYRTALEKKEIRDAEYAKLQAEAKNYCIRAPFDGVVVDFHKEIGEFVGPVEPGVCTVAELTTLSVEFFVPRVYRKSLKINQTISIRFVEANQMVEGLLYYISPYPAGDTNTYTVKIRVNNSDGTLNAGEPCQLDVDGAFEDFSSVPQGRFTTTRN